MRELEGLEGIKFQEVTESGALQRWVIQVDVYVVEVKKANKKSMSKKERRERVESSYHKGDAAMVKKELDLFFNDVKGEGQKNSKGETVYFDFNVKEIVIDGNDKITERELRNKGARKFSTESGELHYVDQETGKNVYLKSPANILLAAVGDDVNTRGHNDQIVTKLNYSERFSGPTLLHEMLHQLITQPGEKEHALGGGLESPAGSINTKNVDQALNDAYLSKDPKRVVTTKK
jgi:hypothetical protein